MPRNRLRLARAAALRGRSAWIGHLSYANLAEIATFGGRYVVGVVANGSETSLRGTLLW